jgi:hypothetical protein
MDEHSFGGERPVGSLAERVGAKGARPMRIDGRRSPR